MGDIEAEVIVDPCGDDAGHDGKLTAGGRLAPTGLIEVIEHESLMGQTVQRGGQLLTDHIGRECLGGNENQVLALEQTRILVLLGRCFRTEIAIERVNAAVTGQRCKIDIQLVVVILFQRRMVHRIDIHIFHDIIQRCFGDTKDGVLHLQTHRSIQAADTHSVVGGIVVGIAVLFRPLQTQQRTQRLGQHQQYQQGDTGFFAQALAGQQMTAENDETQQGQ